MTICSVKLKVHVAWWLKAYLFALVGMCRLTGSEPDMGKVDRWIKRGIRCTVSGGN